MTDWKSKALAVADYWGVKGWAFLRRAEARGWDYETAFKAMDYAVSKGAHSPFYGWRRGMEIEHDRHKPKRAKQPRCTDPLQGKPRHIGSINLGLPPAGVQPSD